MGSSSDRLKASLAENHRLAQSLDQPDFPLDSLLLLQSWQRQRLSETYSDLRADPRYAAAADFFLDRLYGGLNFRERDQEVAKVLPVMTRMLSDSMLDTLAQAFEFQAMSLKLDIAIAIQLHGLGWSELDQDRYCQLYRQCGEPELREKQIELVRHLGQSLNRAVKKPIIYRLIRLLRGPARAAGFGRLQNFLEEGLSAFRSMGDATEFVDTIYHREKKIMQALFRGGLQPFDV